MHKPQRIRDPVHDLIEFDGGEFEQMCWKLLSTSPMQKLRRVKQLGFSDFVFPGATHSRLAHSVGVFHTARTLAASIRRCLPDGRFEQSRAQAAMAAALLHDVGHGPFSHAFESVLGELKLGSHEAKSVKLIREGEIAEVLNSYKPNLSEDVAEIISSEKPKDIYSAIISSQFDADRLDYMRRDRKMTGVQSSHIDFEWIVKNLEIERVQIGQDEIKTGEIETLVVGKKALRAAEGYVLSLFHLYPNVYLHKTTRGAEKIFVCLLRRIMQLALDGSVNKSGLPSSHPLIGFAKQPDSMEKFLQLDDYVIWGALPLLITSKDKLISDFAERLQKRKLYKSIDVTTKLRVAIQGKSASSIPRDELMQQVDKAEAEVRQEIQAKISEMELSGENRMTESKNPAQFVASVVASADGELIGRTRLQKTLCLLELSGLGGGFSYIYHHYGPYSEDVSLAASDASSLGLLSEEVSIASWGGQYSVFRSTEPLEDKEFPEAAKELVQLSKTANGIELELVATAAFLANRGSTTPWEDVAKFKPEKSQSIAQAKQLYENFRKIDVPTKLPAVQ